MPLYDANHQKVLEDLSLRFSSVALATPLSEERAKDPAMVASAFMHQNIIAAMTRFFQFEHEDIKQCVPFFGESSIGADHCVIHLMIPDHLKTIPAKEQMAVYDTLDRFAKRLAGTSEEVYVRMGDVIGHVVNIHYTPQAMIDAMQLLAHKKYRGDAIAVNHLYMAQHMLDQFEARQPLSDLKIH